MPRAKLATKRTVELDTLSIADRLDEIRTNLRIAALACDGLEDTSTGDNSAIANMIIWKANSKRSATDTSREARRGDRLHQTGCGAPSR
jgi:hypothetical protein